MAAINTQVGIVYKVIDDSKTGTASFLRSISSTTKGLAGLAAGVLAFREISRFFISAVKAAAENEKAQRRLKSAMEAAGDSRQSMLLDLQKEAKQLSATTVYEDNQVLAEMAMAKSAGIAAEEIGTITRAAAGLAAMYGKTLPEAMMVLIKARQGESGQLGRMGIILSDTMTAGQKYDELMRRGLTTGMRMAQEQTETLSGSMIMLGKTWNETKAELVQPIIPPLTEWLKNINEKVRDIKETWRTTSEINENLNPPASVMEAARGEYRQKVGRLDPVFSGLEPSAAPGMTPEPKFQQYWDELYGRYVLAWHTARVRANQKMSEQAERSKGAVGSMGSMVPDSKVTREEAQAVIAAYHKMYSELGTMTKESYGYQKALIDQQYMEFIRLTENEVAAARWRNEQLKQLDRQMAESSNNAFLGIRAALQDLDKELGGVAKLAANVTVNAINGISGALAEAVVQGKDLGDAMRQLGLQIATDITKWAIERAIVSSLLSVMGPGFAHGNVFEYGRIRPFASGGIVTQPTIFPMAGGAGLMGESGPEAVLPLKRSASGDLGVRLMGSGGSGRTDQLLGSILQAIRQQQLSVTVPVVRSEEEVYTALRTRRGRQHVMQIIQESK